MAERASVAVVGATGAVGGVLRGILAERGYEELSTWLRGTRDAIASCPCTTGCPSCVQSPKCGNGNEPLDKARAILLLDLTLAHAPAVLPG